MESELSQHCRDGGVEDPADHRRTSLIFITSLLVLPPVPEGSGFNHRESRWFSGDDGTLGTGGVMLRRAATPRLCGFLQPVRAFPPGINSKDTPHSVALQDRSGLCVCTSVCVCKRLLERRHERRFAGVIAAVNPGAQRSTTSIHFPPATPQVTLGSERL